jgi:glycosyltransferase involved in cell wall biosynthesis
VEPHRPRLLVVITLAEVGGAQTYVGALLPAIVERFDVTVAAHGPGPLREAAEQAGASFVPLRHLRRAVNPWHDLLALRELVGLMRRVRPDLVHLNSSKAGILGRLAARLSGVRACVFTVHGWSYAPYRGPARAAYKLLERALAPLASAIVCVSERDASAANGRAVVIRNAVDVGAVPRATPDASAPCMVSVGRLKGPKDFATLRRALEAIEQNGWRALVVGDGPLRPQLEGGPLELLGERDDVPELLAAADLFVLSSRSEGLPLSVIEAMAAGLPVVASAVGGIPELVVDGETGVLVPPGDARALASALRRLLADPQLRRQMGDAGRLRAQQLFDLPRFHAEHLALYARLLTP